MTELLANVNGEQDNNPVATFNVVNWNILLDITRTNNGIIKSQSDRIASQIGTLAALRSQLNGELDAVAIQEAHKENGQHNGEYMSEELGYGAGHWIEHNKKPYPGSPTGRSGEHVGFFGARIEYAEAIELGDNRRAVLSKIGNVAIANIHPRAGKNLDLKEEQVRVVLERLSDYPNAIFVGEFNSHPDGKVREAVENDEFESAFSILGKPQPKTWPTQAYRRVMYGSKDRIASPLKALAPAVLLDDIYVRNVAVHDAGSFVGDSDHAGVWAKLSHDSVTTL
jgi:endonuclease/exonuclease/phosphatase family metal-dependent hydrolase